MRVLVGLLIALAVGYQLFYRYETWPSKTQDGVIYERDNLTGATRQLKFGEKTDLVARLTGRQDDGSLFQSIETSRIEPNVADETKEAMHMSMIEDAKVIPAGKEVVVASNTPPVPDADLRSKPFSVRTVDLNLDGSSEEILQSAVGNDGLLDISILRNGQELFFARGKDISVMGSRSGGGWADIVLNANRTPQIFRYNARVGAYQPLKG